MTAKKKHQKHANLTRPNFGSFGRNELSIIGTPCGNIQKLACELTKRLSEKWKVGYVDADHKSADEANTYGQNPTTAFDNGASLEYTDKITFHRFDSKAQLDTYQYRSYFNEMDLVLVNGNHFKAKQQIVVIDPKKEDSLKRKLDRLTDVQLFLFVEGVSEIPDFLKDHLANYTQIPTLQISDNQKISAFIEQKMSRNIPPLNGLVLAGGKSIRMGKDKGELNYHSKPQREYVYDLLEQFCDNTFLSCRAEQKASFPATMPLLEDTFIGLGPFGGILSAFQKYPNHAWVVLACDLPLLDQKALQFLIENRNPSSIATAFNNPATGFPDPLITIWEPKSHLVLFQFLTQGFSCPRKVLINSDVKVLDAPNPNILKNVNTPEDYEEVMGILAATN